MNKNQYHVLGWLFLGFMLILIYLDLGTLSFNTEFVYNEVQSSNFGTHTAVFDALIDLTIIISFFLFIVFQILGWLEH